VDFWLGGFFVGCFFCWVDLLLDGLFVGWILWSGGFSFSKDFLAVDFVWIFCVGFLLIFTRNNRAKFSHQIRIASQKIHRKFTAKFTGKIHPAKNSPSGKFTPRKIHPAKNLPREKFTPRKFTLRKIHSAGNCHRQRLQPTGNSLGVDILQRNIHTLAPPCQLCLKSPTSCHSLL